MTARRATPSGWTSSDEAHTDDDLTGEWGRCPFQRGANLSTARRARLVADGGGLENRYGVKPIVGSNPTPSALSRALSRFHRAMGSVRKRSAPVVPYVRSLPARAPGLRTAALAIAAKAVDAS